MEQSHCGRSAAPQIKEKGGTTGMSMTRKVLVCALFVAVAIGLEVELRRPAVGTKTTRAVTVAS